MKIQVLSDLHQEFGFVDLTFDKADVVVMAGDVNLGVKGIDWILRTITDVPVIYVLGNHEYYKGSYPKTLNMIKTAAIDSNVHVFGEQGSDYRGCYFSRGNTLDGLRFVGRFQNQRQSLPE